jgi:hypothetical protein
MIILKDREVVIFRKLPGREKLFDLFKQVVEEMLQKR